MRKPQRTKKSSKKKYRGIKIATAIIAVASLLFVIAGCEGSVGTKNENSTEKNLTSNADMTKSTDITSEANLIIEEWQQKDSGTRTDRLIAHGGSTIEGYATTNSLEALLQGIDIGYTLIELDMNLSLDGEVIMIHDYSETLNYYFGQEVKGPLNKMEFEEKLVHGRFHTLTLERLVKIFDKSDGYKIVTDIKDNNLEVLELIAEKYPEYIDRFVPQIYDTSECQMVKELGFTDVILTLYMMESPDFQDIYDCYTEHGLRAVTISEDYFAKDVINGLLNAGVKVYRHPINNFETMQQLFSKGNYGIYTGNILPDEVLGHKSKYYITVRDSEGNLVKLTDYKVESESVKDIVEQKVSGLEELEYRIYYVGEQRLNDQMLAELPFGKQPMRVEIWQCDENFQNGKYRGITLDYWFWRDENGVRILDWKYGYRADSRRVIPNFEETLLRAYQEEEKAVAENAMELLGNSFIASAGNYYYYDNGEPGNYMQDDEFLYVINRENEEETQIFVPLYETGMTLGADSIYMDSQRKVHLEYQNHEYIQKQSQTRLEILGSQNRIEEVSIMLPVLKKNFVASDYLSVVFERDCIVNENVMIILPKGILAKKIDNYTKKVLIKGVENLYNHS